jgi:protocatechuate 3,4-dioxygenase, beta subunit
MPMPTESTASPMPETSRPSGPASAAPVPLGRRRVALALAGLVAGPAVWTGARAQMPVPRKPTPSQTEGPFYPVQIPVDNDADLLRNGTRDYRRGQPAWLAGRVMDLQGQPLRGGVVEIWQCDEAGHYHHPGDGGRADPAFQGFGRATLDADGQYRFRTIRPVAYGGRTPHIHLKVRLGRHELLTTQVYVAGDPGNDRDFLWRRLDEAGRAALTVPFERDGADWRARFDAVVTA